MAINKKQVIKLLKLLKENKVEFIIIGAMAFPAYGFARDTKVLDIFIRPSKENAEKCMKTITEFGYDLEDTSIEDFMKYKILLRQNHLILLDIHPSVKGIDFDTLWKNKNTYKVGDIPTYFALLDDLIKMKKAAGRDQDLVDLKQLVTIKNIKEKNENTQIDKNKGTG